MSTSSPTRPVLAGLVDRARRLARRVVDSIADGEARFWAPRAPRLRSETR